MISGLTLLGVAGMTLFLIAYGLNLWHILVQDSLGYNLLNTLAAALASIYAYAIGSYPFLILNLAWGGLSLYNLAHIGRSRYWRTV